MIAAKDPGVGRPFQGRRVGGPKRPALHLLVFALLSSPAIAQTPAAPPLPLAQLQRPPSAPIVVTLEDALSRARANDSTFLSSLTDATVAHEDRVQARASLLPTITGTTQYLGNQPSTSDTGVVNGNGRFVSLDGVNMYRIWGVVHQDLSLNTLLRTPLRRATAAEAAAQAKLEVAERGLAVTVTKSYFALVASQRKYATAQEATQQASRFFDITRQQQQAGQVAQSDVVKAEIQYQQQQQAFQDALLAMENARLSLAVLIFPALDQNFTVVDDPGSAPALPAFAEAQAMAERNNPDLRAADQTLRAASQDVSAAKNAFFPSIVFDGVYGLEANHIAANAVIDADPTHGKFPTTGYFVTVNLSVPVWDWGGLRSKLHQTQAHERQAQVELSHTQRLLVANLYSAYNEALTARAAVDTLRHVADLAAESLRLTNLRYQAGESTALEVVDAQNTLVQARDAYDDAEVRYRVALAELQAVTGRF
jgi:outer membrane protein TolC